MIYIANQLLKYSTAKEEALKWKQFKEVFKDNIDSQTQKLVTPIVIKYRPGLSKPDRDNPGKIKQPRSLKLSFVAYDVVEGQNTEIRYSRNATRKDAQGNYTYSDNGVAVVDGRLPIMDIDLAFFFWAYSSQNWEKAANKQYNNAFFLIENIAAERAAVAAKKKIEAIVNNRIWADLENGGLVEEVLVRGALAIGINDAEILDIAEVREAVDFVIKHSPQYANVFYEATNRGKNDKVQESKKKKMVDSFVEHDLIGHDLTHNTFYLLDEKKKPSGDKLAKFPVGTGSVRVKFYELLEKDNPELLNTLISKVEEINIRKMQSEGEPLQTA